MGLFDSLVQKVVKPAVQKQVKKVTKSLPPSLSDLNKIDRTIVPDIKLPEPSFSDRISNLFTDDPNSGFFDTKIKPMFSSQPKGRISDEDMAVMDEMEKARLAESQKPGFFENLFTDDPNSGWYDEWKNKQNSPSATSMADLNKLDRQNISKAIISPAVASSGFGDKLSGILGSQGGLAALGVGANVLGGGLGYLASKGDYKEAENTMRQAADLAGAYEALGPSEAAAIKDNENMVALRAKALQGIQQRADMGLTPEDIAELNRVRNQTNAQFQARQATIQQDMSRRGLGNSGMNLAAQLSNNQAQTTQQADLADQQAARSFQAKQQALQSLGNMSSDALQQDFSRDLSRAQSADAISKFNTANKMASQQNKATAVQNIATTQAQAGQRKADMINTMGQSVGSGLAGYAQQKANQPK